jgi:hypothetical protein
LWFMKELTLTPKTMDLLKYLVTEWNYSILQHTSTYDWRTDVLPTCRSYLWSPLGSS